MRLCAPPFLLLLLVLVLVLVIDPLDHEQEHEHDYDGLIDRPGVARKVAALQQGPP